MDLATRNFLILKLAETLGVIAVILIAGTSKRMVYRPVQFKYPQREGRISVSVYILLLAAAVFFYITNFKTNLFAGSSQQALLTQLFLALLSLGIAAFALFYRRQPLLSAGWGGRANLTLGLRMGVMLVFLTIFLRGKLATILNGVTAQEGMALLLLLAICVAEETIFRGYLQLRFNAWLGTPAGWLLTAGLFVLWQVPRLLTDLPGLWLSLPLIIVQSLLLGWLMHKSGHVLAPALYRAVSDWLTILK